MAPRTEAPAPTRRRPDHKGVNLALQGGGAHGAFTWGVLDRFFEDDRIWIDAISGTSAGAMNAIVATQGMYENGAVGAREALAKFWKAVSDGARSSPIRRSTAAKAMGDWSLKMSPTYIFLDLWTRMVSPYQFNPFDLNPLRDLVGGFVDFDKVRGCGDMAVYIAATNVETGRVRVFDHHEIGLDHLMASACLPSLYRSVEIDGTPYWDGGFMGNPPLFPFFRGSPSKDIVIVQINPVERPGTPTTAKDIQNRLNEITFNSSLLHELRAIDFVTRLIESGKLEEGDYNRMNLHVVQSGAEMLALDASSKLNAEWAFLLHLFEIGRETATRWLDANFEDIGQRSSFDVRTMFQGALHDHGTGRGAEAKTTRTATRGR
jgi:NTE family protein